MGYEVIGCYHKADNVDHGDDEDDEVVIEEYRCFQK
mgnify:CR=1 FL=1